MNKCAFHSPSRLNPAAGYAILSPVITPQKQGLIGLTADFRCRPYTNCICLRGIRQTFMQACRLTHCCAKMNRVFVTFHS